MTSHVNFKGWLIAILFLFTGYMVMAKQPIAVSQDWSSPQMGVLLQSDSKGEVWRAEKTTQDNIDRMVLRCPITRKLTPELPMTFRYRIQTLREVLDFRINLIDKSGTRYSYLITKPSPDVWQSDSSPVNELRDDKYRRLWNPQNITTLEYEVLTRGKSGEKVILDFEPVVYEANTTVSEENSFFTYPKRGVFASANPPFISWSLVTGATQYRVTLSQDSLMKYQNAIDYQSDWITTNFHTPTRIIEDGNWYARVEYKTADGIKVSPITRFLISEKSKKFLVPSVPDKLKSVHPYLMVNPTILQRLRNEITNSKQNTWIELTTWLYTTSLQYQPEEPPVFKDGVWDYETWRTIDNKAGAAQTNILQSALIYMVSHDTVAAENARRVMLDVARWKVDGSTGINSVDHAAQGLLYSMSLGYDWLNDYLSDADKKVVRECIRQRADLMYKFLNPLRSDPANNHPWFCTSALGIGGLALYNEVPEAKDWVDYAVQLYCGQYLSLGGPDGEWHEGIAYWSYTLFFVFQFTDSLYEATGVDLYQYPWLKKTASYKINAQPPVSFGVPFGDSKPLLPSAFDALIMSRFASRYKDGLAQWYCTQIPALGKSYLPYYMLWFDSNLKPAVVDNQPASAMWKEWGVAVHHSSLVGADNNMVAIKSGDYLGRRWSHSHPDLNSFVLYGKGEPLLCDSGYYDPSGGVPYGGDHHIEWSLQSKAHNLPLVNGNGQSIFTPGADGEISKYLALKDMLYVCADASNPMIYNWQLDQYKRHLFALDSETYLTWDEIAAPEPARYDWLYHSAFPMTVNPEQRMISITGKKSRLEMRFLNPLKLSYSLSSGFTIVPARKTPTSFPDQYHVAIYPATTTRVDWVPIKDYAEPSSIDSQPGVKLKQTGFGVLYSLSNASGKRPVSCSPLSVPYADAGKIYLGNTHYYYLFNRTNTSLPLTVSANVDQVTDNPLVMLLSSIVSFEAEFRGKGLILGTDQDKHIKRLILVDALSVKALGMTWFQSEKPVSALVDVQKTGVLIQAEVKETTKISLSIDKAPKQVYVDGVLIPAGALWKYDNRAGKLIVQVEPGKHLVRAITK